MANKQGIKQPIPENFKPYCWKKGQSGNPKGRPPGKSLKTYVKEYFQQLPDERKAAFLEQVSPEIVWKMAEGNPETQMDHTTGGEPMFLPTEIITKNNVQISQDPKPSSEEPKEV